MSDDYLRYPIGKFVPADSYSPAELKQFLQRIGTLPQRISDLVRNFSKQEYDTQYRSGGWNGRQVIHHVSDSHMNAYVRVKWTLTEDKPLIKAYNEKLWAETPETSLDPQISLDLLTALHRKFAALLGALKADDLQKEFMHPETGKAVKIERMLALYAWHGDHHLGHLKIIAENKR